MTNLTSTEVILDWSTKEQTPWLDQKTLDKWLGWLEEVISGVSEETWSYLQEGIKYRKNKSED